MAIRKKTVQKEKERKIQEVIFEFVPGLNFEEEFLEFVEKVLNWEENSEEKVENKNKKDVDNLFN